MASRSSARARYCGRGKSSISIGSKTLSSTVRHGSSTEREAIFGEGARHVDDEHGRAKAEPRARAHAALGVPGAFVLGDEIGDVRHSAPVSP